ncbi:hypothetical protein L3V83_00650 [Thiotrichales bacterium 19X7-9]|nr:hypothetical protein [Thiotrichales bacterium 19X7-9]
MTDNTSFLITEWKRRINEYIELKENYKSYCDHSIIKNKVISDLELFITTLPQKISGHLLPEHQNILTKIIHQSINSDYINDVNNTIQQYKNHALDMNKEIDDLAKLLRTIKEIECNYSSINTYSDYYNLGVKPSNFGDKLSLSDVTGSNLLKELIDELDCKIDLYFWHHEKKQYYSDLAEFNACKYFSTSGFTIENATNQYDNGGVDLKVFNPNTSDQFFVEIYCPTVYYDDDFKQIFNNSGGGFVPNNNLANILRTKILPDGKKSIQISKFIKNNKLQAQNTKIYLWLDLTQWLARTKLIYSWGNGNHYPSSLVKILYDQDPICKINKNNSKNDGIKFLQGNPPKICNELTGIICYGNGHTKYIHNPKLVVENPKTEFPPSDVYFFNYDNHFHCTTKNELK